MALAGGIEILEQLLARQVSAALDIPFDLSSYPSRAFDTLLGT